jgi:hypothetical protein
MKANYALSHLKDGEICRAATKFGEYDLLWNKAEWRFYFADMPAPTVCEFDDIEEWQIATVKLHPNLHIT